MEKYLVGGAVRDMLLGRKNSDKDYVIIGSTKEEMLSLGFISVGKSFPVFIKSGVEGEYALARTEKKSGRKHFDFECFTENVSLKDDLKRRDLTINAIAYDEKTKIFIDPFDGLHDIQKKILRPVSIAFKEDALRVLRAARFRAELGREWKLNHKLKKYAFDVREELRYISKERIYKEAKKAMQSTIPSIFFISLYELGALEIVFPWLYLLTKVKNSFVFERLMKVIDLCFDENARWALLLYGISSYKSFLQTEDLCWCHDEEVFQNIPNKIGLNREESKIVNFFAVNYDSLKKIFINSIKPPEMAALLSKIKDKKTLKSLLEATLAEFNSHSDEKCRLFFDKEHISELWQLLRNIDYEIDHKTMDINSIKSMIAGKQTNVIEQFMAKHALILH